MNIEVSIMFNLYYCHVENLFGGQLCVEDDIITPKTNRMVIFAPGSHIMLKILLEIEYHAYNPWDRHVSSINIFQQHYILVILTTIKIIKIIYKVYLSLIMRR